MAKRKRKKNVYARENSFNNHNNWQKIIRDGVFGSSIALHFLFWIPHISSHSHMTVCCAAYDQRTKYKGNEVGRNGLNFFSFFFCTIFPKSFMHRAYIMHDFFCQHQLRSQFIMWKSCVRACNKFIQYWNGLIDLTRVGCFHVYNFCSIPLILELFARSFGLGWNVYPHCIEAILFTSHRHIYKIPNW